MSNLPESTNGRVIAGTAVGIVLGLAGFWIASVGMAGMGFVMFLLVPLVAGGVVGWILPMRKAIGRSALISLIGSLLFLVAAGKEGPLCALMAFPLLLVCVIPGALLGAVLRKAIKPRQDEKITTGMYVLIAPLLIFAGRQVER